MGGGGGPYRGDVLVHGLHQLQNGVLAQLGVRVLPQNNGPVSQSSVWLPAFSCIKPALYVDATQC